MKTARILAFVAFIFSSAAAHALSYPAWATDTGWANTDSGWQPSAGAACSVAAAKLNDTGVFKGATGAVAPNTNDSKCWISVSGLGVVAERTIYTSDYTPNCPTGQSTNREVAGVFQSYSSCSTWCVQRITNNGPVMRNGTTPVFSADIVNGQAGNFSQVYSYTYSNTGETCNVPPAQPRPELPVCKSGYAPGVVNGVADCYPSGNTSSGSGTSGSGGTGSTGSGSGGSTSGSTTPPADSGSTQPGTCNNGSAPNPNGTCTGSTGGSGSSSGSTSQGGTSTTNGGAGIGGGTGSTGYSMPTGDGSASGSGSSSGTGSGSSASGSSSSGSSSGTGASGSGSSTASGSSGGTGSSGSGGTGTNGGNGGTGTDGGSSNNAQPGTSNGSTGSNGSGKCTTSDCSNTGSFGGTCGSFSCEGDAVQCAIALEQHRMNCKLLDTSDNDATATASQDGSDQQSTDQLKKDATSVDVGNFDTRGFGWSRTCPANPRIGVFDRTFEIPFSQVCGVLSIFSIAGVGVTLLACGMWALGGVKS